MAPDPHLLSLLLTSGVGIVMVLAGLNKSALERRNRSKICPSCGRDVHVCGCV